MLLRWTSALALIGATCTVALPNPSGHPDIDNIHWDDSDIITRDVCIIGGGSSGTYAAVRLRDLKQSVVIVEHKDRLGGHTETYTDPATKTNVEIGVIEFHNIDLVKNYFARFDVPLTTLTFGGAPVTDYVDYRTGKLVTGFTPSDPTAALGAYAAQAAKYPYLDSGFDLPDPVPEDLLLSFGEFVTKYNLLAAASLIYSYNEGNGNLANVPTLYVIKLLGLSVLQGIQTGFLTTARHDNSELYEKAQAQLLAANALLLSSHITASDRDADHTGYTRLVVSTPHGRKLIRAKKILLTIPPTLHNLRDFDLDNTEESLFKQFSSAGYYTGLLKNTGIPDNTSVVNTGANTPFNFPVLPGVYSIDPTAIPGVHSVMYGSPTVLSSEKVKDNILADIARLRTAGTLHTTKPEFVVFSSHSPFLMTVPAEAIKAGFYRQLGALQGHRNTWYTGANFHTHDSSLLWVFTEALLPKIVG